MTPQYRRFGELLAHLRQQAGIAHQSELAARLRTTQQTISRWEQGISRPREKDIPGLASILRANAEDLRSAAGYGSEQVAPTFDQPFPIDALSPDSFERFCLHFLTKRYPNAKVHRVGGSGHTQDGLDVDVAFPDQTHFSFQCKRVVEFGPQKVLAAVAKHTRKSEKKFILLTRIASPQARDALKDQESWNIWDKEDISLRIRDLPRDEQRRIVDIFFHGQRLALLGETEPGPWQTSEEFFSPFESRDGAFNHAWALEGRQDECQQLVDALAGTAPLVMLIGGAGTGKSRVVKEAVSLFEHDHRDVLLRFLSPTEEVTNKSLDDLGPGRKVLIVDDAHERGDLKLLFQYAAVPEHRATLLLACRQYGLDYMKAQVGSFSLVGERTTIALSPLSMQQATALAGQVLTKLGASTEFAEHIARLTRDCPLATVLAAHVVAKEKTYFALVQNDDTFRTTLLGRFWDVIAGEIGSKRDFEPIQRLLGVVALVQPFQPDDHSFIELVTRAAELPAYEVNRLLRVMTDGGILFKRGGQHRLSPDQLADYIVENECIGVGRTSTGYAERIFDLATGVYLEHVLLNIGKLDWRLSNGNPSNSRMLDEIWAKLNPSGGYADPHVNAVKAVAYYQPDRALDFVENRIAEGSVIRDLPYIARAAAYTFDYLYRACECLWELGKSDSRPLNPNPNHAIRVLAELCSIEPNKPLSYNETVVDFALSLIADDENWRHTYSPLEILRPVLHSEGTTTTAQGRQIAIGRFYVNLKAVAPLRDKVLDAAYRLLSHPEVRVAVQAAQFLNDGLRYPMSAGKGERRPWTVEFIRVLNRMGEMIRNEDIDPIVFIEIARSVSWHANFGDAKTRSVAKSIIGAFPDTTEFRTLLTLIDWHGQLRGEGKGEAAHRQWTKRIAKVKNDLLSSYSTPEDLLAFLEEQLSRIEESGVRQSGYMLCMELVDESAPLARAVLHAALANAQLHAAPLVAPALAHLLRRLPDEGRDFAAQLLGSDAATLHATAGRAYARLDPVQHKYTPGDLAILRALASSDASIVQCAAAGALRAFAQASAREAIDLLSLIDIGKSLAAADEVLALFGEHEQLGLFAALDEADVRRFLDRLLDLPELDGFGVQTFLARISEEYPRLCAQFFMTRTERAAVWHGEGYYRPCNHGPYCNVPLRFRNSRQFQAVLQDIITWLRSQDASDPHFLWRIGELFSSIAHPVDAEAVAGLRSWVEVTDQTELDLIGSLLSEAQYDFIFTEAEFVQSFLSRAKHFGKQVLERAVSHLLRPTMTGARSGKVGEPNARDLEVKERAETMLQITPRSSPTYALYEMARNDAVSQIEWTLKRAEVLEAC